MTRNKWYKITSGILALVILFNTGLAAIGKPVLQSTTTNYTYDGRGNLISDGTTCIDYNGRNLPAVVKHCNSGIPIEKYYYEANGRRFKVETFDSNGTLVESNLNVDDFVHLKIDELTGQKETSYTVHAGGQVIGKIKPDGSKEYIHSDHLGSVVLTTDPNGNPVGTRTYYGPFGNQVTANQPGVPYAYTGQELDGTGYNWYNSRLYDPQLGTFLAPDSIRPSMAPKDLNPYAYVHNNPLKYTDPTGNFLGIITAAYLVIETLGDAASLGTSLGNFVFKEQSWENASNVAVDLLAVADVGGIGEFTIRLGQAIATEKDTVDKSKMIALIGSAAADTAITRGAGKVLSKAVGKIQNHHALTSLNKTFDFQNEDMTIDSGINLKTYGPNQKNVLNHEGRHTNKYHQSVMDIFNEQRAAWRSGEITAVEGINNTIDLTWYGIRKGDIKLYDDKKVEVLD